jgi:hypothetical protein
MTAVILIVAALAAILAIDSVWSAGLLRRLEVERRKNEKLAQLLEKTMFEAAAAQTRDRAYANYLMMLRNDAVERANEIIRREKSENRKLQVMVSQKWAKAEEGESGR